MDVRHPASCKHDLVPNWDVFDAGWRSLFVFDYTLLVHETKKEVGDQAKRGCTFVFAANQRLTDRTSANDVHTKDIAVGRLAVGV